LENNEFLRGMIPAKEPMRESYENINQFGLCRQPEFGKRNAKGGGHLHSGKLVGHCAGVDTSDLLVCNQRLVSP
jgi:hypothetical protein